jgi:hypothetical protein
MTRLAKVTLVHKQARDTAALYAQQFPDGTVVEFKEPARSLDQNAKFHALCNDLAKSDMEWAGKRRTAAEWKVLLVSGHAIATKEGAEFVPGLEGEFVNLRESTANMGRRRASSLIDYTVAFCAGNDVPMKEYEASR